MQRTPPETIDQIRKLAIDGMSASAIARKIGIDRRTARRFALSAAIEGERAARPFAYTSRIGIELAAEIAAARAEMATAPLFRGGGYA